MAVNEGGAIFLPCLAIARYMVATVVTVFAVVIIVMVITVDVLRPEQITVSIKYGHVQVTDLWHEHVTHRHSETDVISHPEPSVEPRIPSRERPEQEKAQEQIYIYEAVDNVLFRLTLFANNPSGRANVRCKDITVRFLNMPNGRDNFQGMKELGKIILPDFLVEKKSLHWLTRQGSIKDKDVLSYLADRYAGFRSFTGAVHVNVSISSDTPFGRTKVRYVDYYCWPLLVSVDEPSDPEHDLTCEQGYDWSLF